MRHNWRHQKRLRVIKKMSTMRAAKARIRAARVRAGLLEREPQFEPWFPMELGVRDKASGEVAWVDFRSLRDAMRRLSIVQRLYQPGRFRPLSLISR